MLGMKFMCQLQFTRAMKHILEASCASYGRPFERISSRLHPTAFTAYCCMSGDLPCILKIQPNRNVSSGEKRGCCKGT